MNQNLWRRCIGQKSIIRSIACLIVVSALFEPLAASASFKSNLQGLNAGSTNWGGGPLTGYQELDYVPARTLFSGGPATNQVITVDFDHTKSSGTLKGIEDLSGFTNSPNVIITAGPTLSEPSVDIWRYTYTITITNALDGFVQFQARLSAGSHLFTGSSLNLSSPTLSIFKPGAQPGFPDLVIAKRGPSQAKPGQIITYTINYTNLASAATVAKGVQVTDILPSAVTYVPGSANKGGVFSGNTITWDLGNLNPGKRGLLTYKVMVNTNVAITTTFSNFAQILGSQDDANPADNTAIVTTTVVVTPTLIANDDFYSTDKYVPLTIPAPGVLTNDVSSVTNGLTAVLVSIPDNGSVVFNADGSFTYTPLSTFVGIDQFAYIITVGTNSSGPAVVNINDTNSCDILVTNITVGNDPGLCGAVVNYPTPVTTGLCGPVSCLPTNGSFFPVGSNTVTCSSTDGIVRTFQVIVQDRQAPTITCPSNLVIAANSGCNATNVTLGSPVTGDNCSVTSVTNNAPASFASGTNIVTWTVIDSSGNSNTCQQLVVVRDQIPPTIACPSNVTVAANSGCNATNVNLGTPTTSDNCGVVSVTNDAPASFPSGTNVVTWIVADANGNTATCQQLVVVRELTPPTITCPSNMVVAANSGCGATNVALGTPVTADACGVASVTNNAPALLPIGTNVITWTVADASGNTATCQQLVVVRDQTPPSITCPSNVVVTANSSCNATNVVLGSPVTSDNCGIATVTSNAPAVFPVGTNVVTWTAVDTSGNTATCQQMVVVRDLTLPTITCPSNLVVTANAGCGATNVALGLPVTADNCGVAAVTNDAPAVFVLGTNLVTWTVIDNSGNTAACQQEVVVRDLTPPAITCPSNVVVAANSGCNATNVFLGTALASDNCTINVTNNAAAAFPLGTNIVTWTATDASGNSASCQQLVIVRDQTPPIITCPTNVVVTANSGCSATNVALGTPITSDNCSGVATVTNNAPSTFPSGTNLVTWTAVDNSGNTATCQQLVVVHEPSIPTITCPSNVVVTANSGCGATNVSLGIPNTSDLCSVANVTNNAPAFFPVGTNVVTWTVRDNSGNTATCQQLVIVRDLTAPTITCPSNLVVVANSGCLATNVALGTPLTSDNCVVTVTSNAPASFPLGTNIVTWTATDASGNSASCQQLVVVRDQTPPSITCPSNVVVTANSGCSATNVSLGSPVTSDNCGVASVTNNAPASFPSGTNLVTWTVVDNSGNTATCQQLVIVRDQTPPTITCPSTLIVGANAGCTATNVSLTAPTTSDNCGILTVTNNAPASFPLGTNVVTWTAVDNSGNTAACQQLVVVRDLTVPTISCPSNLVIAANSGCFATNVALGPPIASDNCTVNVTNNAPASYPLGTNIVTWTATDTSGNSASCQQLVVVRDQTPPTITCPSNVVVTANSGCSATNVSLGSPVTSDNCGVASVTNNAPASFPSGTNAVTWTVVDNSGNTATCQQLVVVQEPSIPTITCPSNVVTTANAGCGATNVSLGIPNTSDLCSVANVTNNAPAFFPIGTNVVTWTVRDNSGNTATCQQLVIVRDVTAPTITCPSNVVVAVNSLCSATNVALGTPVTADNCGVAAATNNAPASFPRGTNIVTWTVVDNSGNTATCQQLVVVRDQTPPTITCPSNIIVAANSGCNATNVSLGSPVASDNCGVATLTNNAPTSFPSGTNVVTWTAVDGSGNTATCQQLVIVRDQTPPTITCPSTLIVGANAGCTATNVPLTAPTTSDNCGILTVTNNAPASFPLGTNVVTWTAVDNSGNTATCQQMVVIRDQAVPTITCLSNVVVAANSGCSATNVNLGSPVTSDNCGVASVTNNAPASFPAGTNAVTWTVVDNSGNTATCQQLVVVRDQTAPTITCPASIVRSTDPGQCSASNVTFTATATDSCSSGLSISYNPASGSTFPKGVTTVTVTAADGNGNSSTCTFTVTVNDTEKPTIICPSNAVVSAPFGQNSAVVGYSSTANDNCPGVTTACVPPSGSSFPVGVTTVTCTATDSSGNTNSCTFTVTVIAQVGGTLVAEFVTSPMVLNRQTGLFEQSMRLSNTGSNTVDASRVYVLGLPSTNTLYNRSGVGTPSGSTNVAPYVQNNLPLAPGSNVVFLLEYYLPNLKAVTNQTLLAEEVVVAPPPVIPPGAQSVALQTGRDPLQLANGRFMIEWPAIVGRSYMIQYSSDMTNWKTAVQSIVAAGTAVQWMDDGPPKTETPPSQAGSRFYRVFLLPAN